MLKEKIWMNGKYIDKSEGVISVSIAALHYGTSIFEGILCIDSKVFRLRDHIDRLFKSAEVLNYKIAYSKEELYSAIIELVRMNKYKSCYIRPLVFEDADFLDLRSKGRLNSVILCKSFNTLMYAWQMKRKTNVMISKKTRSLWAAGLAHAKVSGKYLNSMIARIEARDAGFNDSILLDGAGRVSEATSSNVFIVKDEVIKTPQRSNTLNGITQDSVMRIGRDLGFTVIEKDIEPPELYNADEVFLTNTARGIVPVSQVDSKKILASNQKGIVKALSDRYIGIINGRDLEYQEWLSHA